MDYENPVTFSVKSIVNSWKDEWNAVTAVSHNKYYDWWALRSKDVLAYDCWDKHQNAEGDCLTIASQWQHRMRGGTKKVDSAFNGVGIYRIKTIIEKKCLYVGSIGEQHVCEHVEYFLLYWHSYFTLILPQKFIL